MWCGPQLKFPIASALKPFFHQKYSLVLFLPCSLPSTVLEPERRDCNVMTVMIILWKSGEATQNLQEVSQD